MLTAGTGFPYMAPSLRGCTFAMTVTLQRASDLIISISARLLTMPETENVEGAAITLVGCVTESTRALKAELSATGMG